MRFILGLFTIMVLHQSNVTAIYQQPFKTYFVPIGCGQPTAEWPSDVGQPPRILSSKEEILSFFAQERERVMRRLRSHL